MPDDKKLEKFYATPEAIENQYHFPERSIRNHALRLFRWIHQAKLPPGVLLDVGCGRGVHLEIAQRFGWEAIGVDASPVSRKMCQERRLTVYEGLDSLEISCGETPFDVVTLWEVIEHSLDPGLLLSRLRRFLKQGGVLALSTPNFNSSVARTDEAAWHELRPPMHLHYFTPMSLKKLLERSGFNVLNQLTYGSYSPWVDRFVDKVAQVFSFSQQSSFLMKVAWYKLSKPYFDYTLQSKMQGLGLLSISSPSCWTPVPRFRRYFFG